MARTGLPKHCGWNADRHGKRRVRFRRSGFTTYLTGTPWSEDFMRQYAQALDGVRWQRENIGAERTRPGSFNELCVRYYRSGEFQCLKASTQRARRNIIERVRAKAGDLPIRLLKRKNLKDMIAAKAGTPHGANNLLKVLRRLLAFAVDEGMLAHNPATGVKRLRTRGGGIHSWTEEEIAAFEARHPIGTKPRLALALLLYTAQRRSDVVRLGWQNIRAGTIAVRQEKTQARLAIPLHPNLLAALNAVSRANLTFIVTEFGKPFATPDAFGHWFRDQCDAAGLPHCSAHGLRKAAARRLAEAGCSVEMIKAITGHKTLSEVARYTADADQERLARQAMDRQIGAEREQELSNLHHRLDKTEGK
jgi:integrase